MFNISMSLFDKGDPTVGSQCSCIRVSNVSDKCLNDIIEMIVHTLLHKNSIKIYNVSSVSDDSLIEIIRKKVSDKGYCLSVGYSIEGFYLHTIAIENKSSKSNDQRLDDLKKEVENSDYNIDLSSTPGIFFKSLMELVDTKRKEVAKTTGLTFDKVLSLLKEGKLATIEGWTGSIGIQFPDKNSKMTVPYFYAKYDDGHVEPVMLDAEDVLSNKWKIIE